VHQGQLVKELTAAELAEAEQQRLVVDVHDIGAAQAAVGKAGIAARLEGKNSLVITDKSAMQHPEKLATFLVEAGCPPSRLVIEQKDLESYFLELVGMKEGKN
jgi:ABC-2 type transport system ATP-binding protein